MAGGGAAAFLTRFAAGSPFFPFCAAADAAGRLAPTLRGCAAGARATPSTEFARGAMKRPRARPTGGAAAPVEVANPALGFAAAPVSEGSRRYGGVGGTSERPSIAGISPAAAREGRGRERERERREISAVVGGFARVLLFPARWTARWRFDADGTASSSALDEYPARRFYRASAGARKTAPRAANDRYIARAAFLQPLLEML